MLQEDTLCRLCKVLCVVAKKHEWKPEEGRTNLFSTPQPHNSLSEHIRHQSTGMCAWVGNAMRWTYVLWITIGLSFISNSAHSISFQNTATRSPLAAWAPPTLHLGAPCWQARIMRVKCDQLRLMMRGDRRGGDCRSIQNPESDSASGVSRRRLLLFGTAFAAGSVLPPSPIGVAEVRSEQQFMTGFLGRLTSKGATKREPEKTANQLIDIKSVGGRQKAARELRMELEEIKRDLQADLQVDRPLCYAVRGGYAECSRQLCKALQSCHQISCLVFAPHENRRRS